MLARDVYSDMVPLILGTMALSAIFNGITSTTACAMKSGAMKHQNSILKFVILPQFPLYYHL